MEDQKKREELQALLNTLSDNQIGKLVTMLDQSRNTGEQAIPHDLLLSILRPTLVHVKPPRVITAQRMLCMPFEDMLSPSDPKEKHPTYIARAAIMPMWTWLTELGGGDFKAICDKFDKSVAEKQVAQQFENAKEIWAKAEELMRPSIEEAINTPAQARAMVSKLGGTSRVEDVNEMLNILHIAPHVESLKKKLPPKPIPELNEGNVNAIVATYTAISDEDPGYEVWGMAAIMRRLLRDAEIMKIVRALSREGNDTLASMTDLSIIGDVVIGQVEEYIENIQSLRGEEGRELDIMGLAREYVASFTAVTSNLDIKREGEWGQRMMDSKKQISEAIEKYILEDGKKNINGALKTRRQRKGSKVSAVIDMREMPDQDAYREAERRAKAINQCLKIAPRIGLQSRAQSLANDIAKDLEGYGEKMLPHLDNVPEQHMPKARAHVIMVAHLLELISGADYADIFRKRALGNISYSSEKQAAEAGGNDNQAGEDAAAM